MTTIEEIEAHYARMNMLAEIPRPRASQDVTNPGTSRPENGKGPGLPAIDQTMSVSISSNSARTSDGQEQRLDLAPLQGGVTVLEVPKMATRAFNGQFQSRNLKPIDQGTRTSVGAHSPVNVNVSKQNLHVVPLVEITGTPPARDVRPGDRKPGGLPTSVSIK